MVRIRLMLRWNDERRSPGAVSGRMRRARGGALARALTAAIVVLLIFWPAATRAAEPECSTLAAHHVEMQQNLHASELLVKCGVEKGGSTATLPRTIEPAFSGSDVDVITGAEKYPHVTQSESSVWSHGSTVVVNYNDARGDTESPVNYSGVSISKDVGATFTRLGPPSPLTGHGGNYGDPILVWNEKLGKWFAGDLVGGCGGQGVGLWTSTNGETWAVGACAHNGTEDDRESMWVDNNPASPHYGRLYISFNNFANGGGALEVTHSDDGATWSTPVTLSPGSEFRRDTQLTGSLGSDGTVFLVGLNENGGHVGNTGQQNWMFRSTDGGTEWTKTTMGGTFTIAGSQSCGYFPAIPPIWRQSGYGQPVVGPNGVVSYVYAAHGEGSDESDIFYVRSTDNGVTWSAPIRLNTDSSGKAQWMPSLRVTPAGVLEASWYDRRNTTNGENYQRFARVSKDDGATWGPDEALSTVMIPQPTQPDPNIKACYAGDYNYTTTSASTGFDTWTDGRVSVEGHPTQKVFFHSAPLAFPPTATTEPATNVLNVSATLNGTVNPEGAETKYYFEYGTTNAYGKKTAEESAGSGTTGLHESKAISGLSAKTTYHFRLVATNAFGTTKGADHEFTTLANTPVVTTGEATNIKATSATLNGTVNPLGKATTYYFEYGTTQSYGSKTAEVNAGSGTSPLEVSSAVSGLTPETTYHYRIAAKNSAGVSDGQDRTFTTAAPAWSLQETPNPSGAKETKLNKVSCSSSTSCIAVGEYKNAEESTLPLAETWNGVEWRLMSVPTPPNARNSRFRDVSCSSATACTAIGYYSNGSEEVTLAERWQGTEWSIQPTPNLGNPSLLFGVSCPSSTTCIAVGIYQTANKEEAPGLAERWNGKEWRAEPLPIKGKTEIGNLQSVSCPSTTSCSAVGGNGVFGGSPLIYHWNGAEWSVQKPAEPSGKLLDGVWCLSQAQCMAVGRTSNEYALAESWNGTEWRSTPTATLNGAKSSVMSDVACGSTSTCIAVGEYEDSAGSKLILDERWNGVEWNTQSVPEPSGESESRLEGVSCVSSTVCSSVGSYRNSAGVVVSFAERYL